MKKTFYLAGVLFMALSCQNAESVSDEETVDLDENTKEDSVSMEAEAMTSMEPSLEMAWETDTVLNTNESVLYYPEENMLFVSNIVGQPTEKDGMGTISKLSTSGEIMEKDWVTGLDAPKGMATHDGMLYVTNIDELVEIEISSGEIKNRYAVEGAKFANDVAAAGGKVYFSDMNTGKLHLLENGKVSTVQEGLKGINGLAYNAEEDQLYMLTGAGLQRMVGDSMETVNKQVTGGDGLIILDEDTYLASRWQGEIWLIDGGKTTKLLDSKADEIQTADIGYYPEEKLVLVPRFFSNKVTAYTLNY